MLQQKRIPYQINSIHFHDRKEILDITNVMEFILNPEDETLFKECIQKFHGIGISTIEKIVAERDLIKEPLLKVAQLPLQRITVEQQKTLKMFCETILEIQTATLQEQLKVIADRLVPAPQSNEQIQNVKTFLNLFEEQDISLKDAMKYIIEDAKETGVKLMTLHGSKGTENDIIFIIGAEEGLIPDENSFINTKAIEEERRLFYVGLTRARKLLVLSHVQNRLINKIRLTQQPSRFLNEIPDKEYL